MPIDPSIPLRAQAPPPPDLFGSLGQILQIRQLQRREQQEQRELQKQQQWEQLANQYGDDPEEFITQVSRVDPMAAQKFAHQWQQARKEQFSAYEKQLDGETKELETATRTLQAIPDGDVQGYAGWRAQWTSRNPQLGQILPPPEQFTPDVKERLLTLGVSTLEFNKAKAEGLKAFVSGDYRKGLGNALAVAPSLEIAQQTIAEAEKAVPKAAQGDVALFKSMLANAPDFATFRAQAAEASMTAKERADLAGKATDDARQAEQFGETKRHNAATEAIARGNLSVALGNLRVRQQEANKPKGLGDGKPATGAERRALNFFNRAKQASDELDVVADAVGKQGYFGQLWMNNAPNVMQTKEGQAYNAAQRAFTEARLRKDSGAAIPEHELVNDKKTYFQQPGDSDETKAQKTRMRAGVLASLAYESGRALGEFYGDEAIGMIEGLKSISAQSGGGKKAGPSPVAASSAGVERWERGPDGKMRKVRQ